MMPVVRISDPTFADLKTLSTWLKTKTPGDTIEKIVRQAMDELGLERDAEPENEPIITSGGAMEFDNVPGLAFTKPLGASVNGTAIRSPRWRNILHAVIAQVKEKGFEGERLVRELNIPAKAEQYKEEGFAYHDELGISVQGQSASDAWREIDRLATKWRIPITVEFWWRQNSKAQYPGRTGVLRSGKA